MMRSLKMGKHLLCAWGVLQQQLSETSLSAPTRPQVLLAAPALHLLLLHWPTLIC